MMTIAIAMKKRKSDMGKFREAVRCKSCGKIYQDGIPVFCNKCGVKLGEEFPTIPFPTSYFGMMLKELNEGKLKITDNCEKVVAKRKLFGWKIKENED